MSVSTRVSIAWAPDFVPTENTSTLVLTGRRYFVDQRVFLPLARDSTDAEASTSKVDWAFAGTREAQAATGSDVGWTHSRWTHLVDSRSEDPSPDEGLLKSPYDGDESLTEEKGEMVNPKTVKVTRHREIWKDFEVPTGTRVCFWERPDGRGSRGSNAPAMVGVVGNDAVAVGRDGAGKEAWTWRRRRRDGRSWELVFEEPRGASKKGEGLLGRTEAATEGEAEVVDGEIWVVREAWSTPDSI